MSEIDGRLICCSCGNDLGDADDPYRDPDCEVCLRRELEQLDELDRAHRAGCSCPCHYDDTEVAPHHTCCQQRHFVDAQA